MKKIFASVLILLAVFPAVAQSSQELIRQGRSLLEVNDYAGADAKLAQIPAGEARTAADAYTEFGVIEYNRKNYRNAYSAFRSALKLQATNQTATQYYLRIRREMDVANLRNEYVPPVAVIPPETIPATPTVPATDTASTTQNATPRAETPQERSEDLQILIAQLKAAEDRLNSAQTSVSSTQGENSTLRTQLESQRVMVERMLANQRNTPVVTNSTAENAQLAQTIKILSELAERPVIVQSDPAIQSLITELNEDRKADFDPFSSRNLFTTVMLIAISLLMISVITFFILALVRSRKNVQGTPSEPYRGSYGILPVGLENTGGSAFFPGPRNAGLLEYNQGSSRSGTDEMDITRSLVRADHLQKMYEDMRKGNLSWETIRTYIDDLEKSLRTDILKVVETKLETGALLNGEAALPVLFPFLTDFDDYLSDKAQELAKNAVLTSRTSRGSNEEDNLFSIAALSDIPKKLAEVTQNKDRSMVTAQLAFGIAKKIGLSKIESEDVYKGAIAHDAGYLMLDAGKLQRIITKEEITEDEWKYIQSHVSKGIEYFGGAEVPELIRDAILHHHERNDGSGYPKGLKKERIPLSAQIVGISETFATLISPRAYRDRHEVGHALAIIRDGARRKFDNELVTALQEVVKAHGGIV